MNCKLPLRRRVRGPVLAGAMLGATALGAAEPGDPAAAIPPTAYESALPATTGEYLTRTDAERLPWRGRFEPDGRFAAEPGARADGTGDAAGTAMRSHAGHVGPSTPGTGSDARAMVRTIDAGAGRVTLEHGPIAKLGMPGMTMVFRVKEPGLLEQVKPGDEVGFTVELEGTTFYVTGFQP